MSEVEVVTQTRVGSEPVTGADEVARLDRVVEGVVDALLEGAITSGEDVGWPVWDLSPEGRPTAVRAGHPALYDGDAGIAWALAELGTLTGREEAVELAARAVRGAAGRCQEGGDVLTGRTGLQLAARVVGARLGSLGTGPGPLQGGRLRRPWPASRPSAPGAIRTEDVDAVGSRSDGSARELLRRHGWAPLTSVPQAVRADGVDAVGSGPPLVRRPAPAPWTSVLDPVRDDDVDAAGTGHDLTGGLAGALLCLRTDAVGARRAASVLDALGAAARREPVGCCWPGAADAGFGAPGGRPLCGLAHGASGVVLALTETARRFPHLAADALALADQALAWEAAWFDPVGGGWPDLRDDDPAAAAPLWCHGAAGIGLVRLALLAAAPQGAPWPIESVAADAEVAVAAAQRALQQGLAGVEEHGWDAAPGGLTLCHGLGGPLELLLEASRVWGDAELLVSTRTAALRLAERLPEDPWEWPGGLAGAEGVAGLFVGFAGAGLTLARLAHPDAGVVGAALLGVQVGAAADAR